LISAAAKTRARELMLRDLTTKAFLLASEALPCDSDPTESVHAILNLLPHELIDKKPDIRLESGL
jgi:hypothetical protein